MRVRRELFSTAMAAVWPMLAPCIGLTVVAWLATFGSQSLERTATSMLISVIVVVGLYTFVGNSGVLSFGHISFMAIGAYSTALVTIPAVMKATLLPDLPSWFQGFTVNTIPGVVVGAAIAAIFAVLVGIPLMRLSGLAAGIATFALLIIVNNVIAHWDAVTRGFRSMLGVPVDVSLFGALAWALVAIMASYLFQRSKVGIRLRAARDDEPAARSIGIGVLWERLAALGLSAFIVGMGGGLYGHLQGGFFPDSFFFELTAITFAMLVIGGIASLSGAVLGAVAVSVLAELLRQMETGFNIGDLRIEVRPGLQEIVLAVLMLIVLIARPAGLTRGREASWPPGRRMRRSPTSVEDWRDGVRLAPAPRDAKDAE